MEYAITDKTNGRVVNIVTTNKSLSEMEMAWSDYKVRPLERSDLAELEKYRYWNERP